MPDTLVAAPSASPVRPLAVHCPHCQGALADGTQWPYPAAAERCRHCGLVIGAGRGKRLTPAQVLTRGRGSAAGVLLNAARRDENAAETDIDTVAAAIVKVAEDAGTNPARLRMLDYQQGVEADPSLPSLASVLSVHRSWKDARAYAAGTIPVAPGA